MNTVLTTALIAIAALSFGTQANAETRAPTQVTPIEGAKVDRLAAFRSQAKVRENVAKEWTLACYAEFGPDAKYPDAALLEKCLN